MSADPEGGGHHAGFGYHAKLVGDPFRIVAYERALRLLVHPGDAVLDVGTGTGLLAVLAARAGAGRVVAVESTPMARTARAVVAENGLEDSVEVLEADIRHLPLPDAAVDLVVSDCLGRFVLDDFMTEAMATALRWLKPGGRVIPAEVRLFGAPVAAGYVDALDLWHTHPLGIAMGSVAEAALHRPIGVSLGAGALLAAPRELGRWCPGDLGLSMAGDPVSFDVTTPGRLVGVAGWFEATLAPGVVLSTAPGIGTHWGQLLFPVRGRAVDAGAALAFALEAVGSDREPLYRWRLSTDGGGAESYGHRSVPDSRPRAPSSPPGPAAPGVPATIDAARAAGALAAEAGDFDAAARLLVGALVAGASGSMAERVSMAADAGAALLLAGRPAEALPLLLLGAEAASDLKGAAVAPDVVEQSLRLAVDAAFQTERSEDGARLLRRYEAAFGDHPSGWRPAVAGSPSG